MLSSRRPSEPDPPAKQRCDRTVYPVRQPLQFGPGKTTTVTAGVFTRLPLLEGEKAMRFSSRRAEMFRRASDIGIGGKAGQRLDASGAPATSTRCHDVAKLFISEPHRAFFDRKRAAGAILRAMVRELNFPLELKSVPRCASDGLAMSSRNSI